MKKIVAIILSALMILTPMMSLAAPELRSHRKLGSALQETISLGGEYSIVVPRGLFLVQEVQEQNMEALCYVDADIAKEFIILAIDTTSQEQATKQTTRRMQNTHSKANMETIQRPAPLPEALEEVLGDNGYLYRTDDGENVSYELIILGEGAYIYSILSYGSLEMEDEIQSWIEGLRKA